MSTLLILLLFPLMWPFIAQRIWREEITYKEMGLHILICTILVFIVYQCGIYGKTHDTEIWNGKITKKHRDHGTYTVTYPCNCHSCGKSTCCSTCHTRHYTVDWDAESTAGHIDLDHADWTSPAVYLLPDPQQYNQCQAGQFAAVEHSYENYIKAVPESLFHKSPADGQSTIPNYPPVFNYYKYNRVICDVPLLAQGTADLNDLLNESLKSLGPEKQVNVIVFITFNPDQNFMEDVQNGWIGGKKNDILVFLGMDGAYIQWTGAATWARSKGNELLAVHLRNELGDIKQFDAKKITTVIINSINQYYIRPKMEDYEYLKDEIEPPGWVIVLAALIAVIGSLGLTIYFYKEDVL